MRVTVRPRDDLRNVVTSEEGRRLGVIEGRLVEGLCVGKSVVRLLSA